MKALAERHIKILTDRASILSFLVSLAIFIGSLFINYFANQYAFISQSNAVTDIILDNLPVVNMENAFVYGTWFFIALVFIMLMTFPHKIPFVLKSMALFIVIRSLFVTLTHIGPSPLNTLSSPSDIGRAFSSGADLFFSGHTGMPFLFALMYWYNRNLRTLFLAISIIAGISVLLGHIHYSIDVASAFFITYGIYIIATRIFSREWEQFKKI